MRAKHVICLTFLCNLGLGGVISQVQAAERSFLMGTAITGPSLQFVFENLSDKDLLSLHLDDFIGIPWSAFENGTPPPQAWVNKWEAIKSSAVASGKVLYLAVSPLTDRITLTKDVDASGNTISNWAPVDSNGCYPFATDASAQRYKQAYINYSKWVINQTQPTYFSPAVEINIEFKTCPSQKAAYIQWYSDVHQALKETYPNLIIFPTFQVENMYGLSDAAAWCGGIKTDASLAACFQERLNEAVRIPGDRMAFSFYPTLWNLSPIAPDDYTPSPPYEDLFSRVQKTTRRKIWISETGWPAVQIYSSYQHASPPAACGSVVIPVPQVAGETNMTSYMSQLLAQAASKKFEAVVWWESRDLLDENLAAQCPCPGSNTTCNDSETFYQAGGIFLEFLIRIFGNMGLRHYDGTPRSAVYDIWTSYLNQPFSPVPDSANPLNDIQVYPNPMRPSRGHTGIHFTQLPPGTRLRIYTLAGEKVKDLTANTIGQATWDGTNQVGEKVASGVYFVYIQSSGSEKTLKVAIQR